MNMSDLNLAHIIQLHSNLIKESNNNNNDKKIPSNYHKKKKKRKFHFQKQ